MKIIALGDTHGRDIWEQIIKAEKNVDKIVFIGDYFDTKENISAAEQILNFNEICKFKEENPDKVVLLIGNHDFHYLRGLPSSEQYSGYQVTHWVDIQEALHAALDKKLIQVCYQQDGILFSHAGVTKSWCKNHSVDIDNIEQSINDKFSENYVNLLRFQGWDMHGDDPQQSPIWVRPKSLEQDRVEGFTQVVGHTMQDRMIIGKYLVFIDTLGTSKQYLHIEGDALKPKKLEQ